jgi:proteasome lid subunit RPN8/RPN11
MTSEKKMVIASVNAKSGDGSLRQALERANIPDRAVQSLVNRAMSHRFLDGKHVQDGTVRQALEFAGWSEEEIDYILYRSQSSVYDKDPAAKEPAKEYAAVAVVRLVKEATVPSFDVSSSARAAEFARPFFEGLPIEHFGVMLLNSANRVILYSKVSEGILNSSLVHPREVFQRAILGNACGVILVHNHPSGNPEPSGEDLRVTRQLVEGGKVLGIPVHDHLILTPDGKFTSFAERGLL